MFRMYVYVRPSPFFFLCLSIPTIFSTQTLDFFYPTQVLNSPTEVSKSSLQISLNPAIPTFRLEKFKEHIDKLLIHLENAKLNQNIKIILTNLKEQYTYFLTLLTTRKTKFINEISPSLLPCHLELALLPPTAGTSAETVTNILATMSPSPSAQADFSSINTDFSAQLIGTILPFTNILNTLNNQLDQEYDILQSVKQGIIPPYFYAFLANAECLSPAIENKYRIINSTITKIGLIANIEVTQILAQKSYLLLTGTPFKSWSLNMSTLNLPVVKTTSNSIVTLNCSNKDSYCKEQNYDMTCLNDLHNKHFENAKQSCKFFRDYSVPRLAIDGVLIPGTSEYSVGEIGPSFSTDLPFIIQPRANLKVKYNSSSYHFGATHKEKTNLIPFILTELETNRLVNLLENPVLRYSFTLIEKILMGVSSGVLSVLLTILACSVKTYSHKYSRTPNSQPNIVFRVATRKV